jgi:uncharacterized protein YkwD
MRTALIASIIALTIFTAINLNRDTPLEYSEKLSDLANIRAQEASELFSHKRPDGRLWHSVLADNEVYCYAGECLAYVYAPEDVVNAWMDSESHKNVIINSDFNYIGIGYCEKDGIPYYCILLSN